MTSDPPETGRPHLMPSRRDSRQPGRHGDPGPPCHHWHDALARSDGRDQRVPCSYHFRVTSHRFTVGAIPSVGNDDAGLTGCGDPAGLSFTRQAPLPVRRSPEWVPTVPTMATPLTPALSAYRLIANPLVNPLPPVARANLPCLSGEPSFRQGDVLAPVTLHRARTRAMKLVSP